MLLQVTPYFVSHLLYIPENTSIWMGDDGTVAAKDNRKLKKDLDFCVEAKKEYRGKERAREKNNSKNIVQDMEESSANPQILQKICLS
ncbi:transcription-repair coupling factor [Sesbania bispinosa]|nr:transcription-repair coupling factor [Sesbania bispinosa]